MLSPLLITSAVLYASFVDARKMTVKNDCSFTVWPAMYTDPNVGGPIPKHPTGWTAKPGSSVSFDVPDKWTAGRIWGRTNCDFSKNPGPTSCLSGGCNGGLECDHKTGTGVPPVTLAEFTLSGDEGGSNDNLDVSLVDGFNLPMRIDNSVGCGIPSCPANLNPKCPNPLKGPKDSKGKVVSCNSACTANLDGNPSNSPNCCSGKYSGGPKQCPPSGVQFYHFFKDNCPHSYAYAYDEPSKTALWKCPSKKKADYTVTFCPKKKGFSGGWEADTDQVVMGMDTDE